MSYFGFDFAPGWESTFTWAVYLGFVTCFFLSFAMGANDTANSYGTVVGAGVLTLVQVYAMATFTETLGAGLLGYRVTETMRKSVIDLDMYNIYAVTNSRSNTTHLLVNYTNCNEWNATNYADPDLSCIQYTEPSLIIGELAALISTSIWLLAATFLKMPVSTTQSSAAATIGFSLVLKGFKGINWTTVGSICASWVLSPLLAGALGSIFYLAIKALCLSRKDPFLASLQAMPGIAFFCILINSFSVFFGGSKYLHFDELNEWEAALCSFGVAGLAAGLFWFFGMPVVRRKATEMYEEELERGDEPAAKLTSPIADWSKKISRSVSRQSMISPKSAPARISDRITPLNGATLNKDTLTEKPPIRSSSGGSSPLKDTQPSQTPGADSLSSGIPGPVDPQSLTERLYQLIQPMKEDPKTVKVFHFLQILSAAFLSFSHGSNDTANSVAPLVGLWVVWEFGTASADISLDYRSELIILYGAICMVVGLWVLGHKVIQTVGRDITELSAPVGFAIEMACAFTVLMGSLYKMPLSTTHCMVGGVTIVGYLRSRQKIEWKLMSGIALTWVVTLPITAAVSALLTYLLGHFYLGVV